MRQKLKRDFFGKGHMTFLGREISRMVRGCKTTSTKTLHLSEVLRSEIITFFLIIFLITTSKTLRDELTLFSDLPRDKGINGVTAFKEKQQKENK